MKLLILFLFRLYTERLNQVELRLSEARAGTATEYLVPLAELKKSFMIRTQVSGEWLVLYYAL